MDWIIIAHTFAIVSGHCSFYSHCFLFTKRLLVVISKVGDSDCKSYVLLSAVHQALFQVFHTYLT